MHRSDTRDTRRSRYPPPERDGASWHCGSSSWRCRCATWCSIGAAWPNSPRRVCSAPTAQRDAHCHDGLTTSVSSCTPATGAGRGCYCSGADAPWGGYWGRRACRRGGVTTDPFSERGCCDTGKPPSRPPSSTVALAPRCCGVLQRCVLLLCAARAAGPRLAAAVPRFCGAHCCKRDCASQRRPQRAPSCSRRPHLPPVCSAHHALFCCRALSCSSHFRCRAHPLAGPPAGGACAASRRTSIRRVCTRNAAPTPAAACMGRCAHGRRSSAPGALHGTGCTRRRTRDSSRPDACAARPRRFTNVGSGFSCSVWGGGRRGARCSARCACELFCGFWHSAVAVGATPRLGASVRDARGHPLRQCCRERHWGRWGGSPRSLPRAMRYVGGGGLGRGRARSQPPRRDTRRPWRRGIPRRDHAVRGRRHSILCGARAARRCGTRCAHCRGFALVLPGHDAAGTRCAHRRAPLPGRQPQGCSCVQGVVVLMRGGGSVSGSVSGGGPPTNKQTHTRQQHTPIGPAQPKARPTSTAMRGG